MGSTSDKVKGVANEAVGNIKQGVGKATDNDRMRAEGVVQEKKVKPSKPWARPRMQSRKALTRHNRPVEKSIETAICGWPFSCRLELAPGKLFQSRQTGYFCLG